MLYVTGGNVRRETGTGNRRAERAERAQRTEKTERAEK
jgi:hypothetical protein